MNSVFGFLASTAGRWTRIIAGLILIALGIFVPFETAIWSWVLIIIGMAPLLAGIFDVCLLAPLFGYPFQGPNLRRKV